jgi:hypothetical protein
MFTDVMRRASLAHHTKDQLRSVITHKKPPTLTGFARHLAEYKRVHLAVAKPCDFYLADIDRDLCALWDPEMPPFESQRSEYVEYLGLLKPHVQGAHWYVLSCAHASGGPVIADSLGFSSYFLRARDITPIKDAFEEWTLTWTDLQKQECVDEVQNVFVHASRVNQMMYSR